jgi:transposase
MVFVVRTVFQVCAVEKVFPPTCTIAGKDFLEAGKKRLMGDTTREASSHEVVDLKKENEHLKQLVAEIALKNRVLKKSLNGSGFEDIDL